VRQPVTATQEAAGRHLTAEGFGDARNLADSQCLFDVCNQEGIAPLCRVRWGTRFDWPEQEGSTSHK
jgi:hypothetical protein